MTSQTKAGGTFIGDAANMLIPVGLLAAREGLKMLKNKQKPKTSSKKDTPTPTTSMRRPASAKPSASSSRKPSTAATTRRPASAAATSSSSTRKPSKNGKTRRNIYGGEGDPLTIAKSFMGIGGTHPTKQAAFKETLKSARQKQLVTSFLNMANTIASSHTL